MISELQTSFSLLCLPNDRVFNYGTTLASPNFAFQLISRCFFPLWSLGVHSYLILAVHSFVLHNDKKSHFLQNFSLLTFSLMLLCVETFDEPKLKLVEHMYGCVLSPTTSKVRIWYLTDINLLPWFNSSQIESIKGLFYRNSILYDFVLQSFLKLRDHFPKY